MNQMFSRNFYLWLVAGVTIICFADQDEIETRLLSTTAEIKKFPALTKSEIKNINYDRTLLSHDIRSMDFEEARSLGMSNQLMKIVQQIKFGCKYGVYVREESFRLDIRSEIFGDIDDVIDIDKTNTNLGCTRIIKANEATKFSNIVKYNYKQLDNSVGNWLQPLFDVKSDYHQYYKYIVLADGNQTVWKPREMMQLPSSPYYAIHFRMEMDWLIFQWGRFTVFNPWLEESKKGIV